MRKSKWIVRLQFLANPDGVLGSTFIEKPGKFNTGFVGNRHGFESGFFDNSG